MFGLNRFVALFALYGVLATLAPSSSVAQSGPPLRTSPPVSESAPELWTAIAPGSPAYAVASARVALRSRVAVNHQLVSINQALLRPDNENAPKFVTLNLGDEVVVARRKRSAWSGNASTFFSWEGEIVSREYQDGVDPFSSVSFSVDSATGNVSGGVRLGSTWTKGHQRQYDIGILIHGVQLLEGVTLYPRSHSHASQYIVRQAPAERDLPPLPPEYKVVPSVIPRTPRASPPLPQQQRNVPKQLQKSELTPTIDVVVLFSHDAWQPLDDTDDEVRDAKMVALADEQIVRLNGIVSNSRLETAPAFAFNLVTAVHLPSFQFLAPYDLQGALSSLQTNPNVTRARDEYGADLVVVIVEGPGVGDPSSTDCGLSNRPSFPFNLNFPNPAVDWISVIRKPCGTFSTGALIAHEIGHNFGNRHDVFEEFSHWAVQATPSGILSPYADGRGYVYPARRYRDVMGYDTECRAMWSEADCEVKLQYSSPLASVPWPTVLGLPPTPIGGLRSNIPGATLVGEVVLTSAIADAISVMERNAFPISQFRPTDGCVYSLEWLDGPAPDALGALHFEAGGGSAIGKLTFDRNCGVYISGLPPWLILLTDNVTVLDQAHDTVPVVLDVGANPGPFREAQFVVGVGGNSVNVGVAQGSACTYRLSYAGTSYERASLSSTARSVDFTVSTGAQCPWQAFTDSAWATPQSPGAGVGSGTVRVNIAANSPSTSARVAQLTIANAPTGDPEALSFSITQDCPYAVTAPAVAGWGGSASLRVACAGSSTTVTTAATWLHFPTPFNIDGNLSYDVDANPGTGARNATVTVHTADPIGQPGTLMLGETSFTVTQNVNARLGLDVTTQDFGVVGFGVVGPARYFHLTNIGAINVKLVAINESGAISEFQHRYSEFTCGGGTWLSPGQFCRLAYNYNPSNNGPDTLNVTITSQQAATLTATLTGVGVVPTAAVDMASQDFGEVGYAMPLGPRKYVTVRNTGTLGNVTLGLIKETTGTSEMQAYKQNNEYTCIYTGHVLTPGSSCRLAYSYRPVDAGTDTLVVTIPTNVGTTLTASVTGTGVMPTAALEGGGQSFGEVGFGTNGVLRYLLLRNTGATGRLTVGAISETGAIAEITRYQQDGQWTCFQGTVLGPNDTCRMAYLYRPADNGADTLAVTVPTQGAGTLTATLTGSGVLPTVTIGADPSDFGAVPVGQPASEYRTLKIRNSGVLGRVYLSSIALAGDRTHFQARNGGFDGWSCSTPMWLNPGEECAMPFAYWPQTAGMHTLDVAVPTNAVGTLHGLLTGTAF